MDLFEYMKQRRAILVGQRDQAQINFCTADGAVRELDAIIDQVTPKVSIVMLPEDGTDNGDGGSPEDPDGPDGGNQQYDLKTLKVEENAK